MYIKKGRMYRLEHEEREKCGLGREVRNRNNKSAKERSKTKRKIPSGAEFK